MDEFDDIRVITDPVADRLNQRQLTDYRTHRENCIEWLLTTGKDPDKAEGYAHATVKNRVARMDIFYRWVWDEFDGYTTDVRHEHADAWVQQLANRDCSNAHKNTNLKALQMLFKWRQHQHGLDEWEPELRFSTGDRTTQPRDFLTVEERRQIREAALEYGSVPAYSSLTPDDRDRWRRYLAQRFEKPKSDVTPNDWDRANSWKVPSLVWVSLDTGLRPVEVRRAHIGWVDLANDVLRIPKDESSKNTNNWIVGIKEETADALERWLDERELYDQYENTDTLWLTKHGNPYTSSPLAYMLERLCDIADINTANRKMTWYAIRHSVGTYMAREEDLAAAQAQLRHKSVQTTMKYDQTPVEDRRDALDRMG